MEKFSQETLKSLIGDKVNVSIPDSDHVSLTITAVENSTLNGDEWEAFCVTLSGDDSFHLPQGTYRMSHSVFGDQELFLSPNSNTVYEIIVNRKRA